jgi:hypothetical protein
LSIQKEFNVLSLAALSLTLLLPNFLPPAITQVRSQTSLLQPVDKQVTEIVSRLTGVMETQTPASTGKVVTVQMTTCPIQVLNDTQQGTPGIFLYQEQALSDRLSKPYRQRFLQILSIDNRQVESRAFRPRSPEPWINFCDQSPSERTVLSSDMKPMNCSVFLRQERQNYVGATQASGCSTKYKGAVRVTNEIVLFERGMETRDRGYDARGNLIWGAREEPYRYRKISN